MEGISTPIIRCATEFRFKPELIAAIICQESGGDRHACRFELGFFAKRLSWRTRNQLSGWTPKPGTVPTLLSEKYGRAWSWGPMQVLGETARVEGFTGKYFTELCDPEVGIYYGCKHLRRHMDRTGELRAALLSYNGGANKFYPDEVQSWITDGHAAKLLAA